MGVFDGMSDATETYNAVYFEEGDYIVRLKKARHFVSQNGKGNVVAIECVILRVLRALGPRASWIQPHVTLKPSNAEGTVASQILLLDQQKPALGNLKNLLKAVAGISEQEIIENGLALYQAKHDRALTQQEIANSAAIGWAAFAETATSEGGEAFAGRIARATCNMRKTRDKGNPFNAVVYSPPTPLDLAEFDPDNATDDAKARLAELVASGNAPAGVPIPTGPARTATQASPADAAPVDPSLATFGA